MPRVLVVEDQEVNRRVLAGQLAHLGVQVDLVADGFTALEVLLAGGFDLVLMDVQLPGLDGYEVTRRVRAAGVRVPILAVTASALAGEESRCREAGMEGMLVKPVRLEFLREALAGRLQVADRTSHGRRRMPRLDPQRWRELVRLGTAVGGVHSLGRTLLHEAPIHRDEAQHHLATGAHGAFRQRVHRLVGAAAAVGLLRLAAVLRDAEAEDPPGGPAWATVADELPLSLAVLQEALASLGEEDIC